jgi:tetratricopeptide (TPR) repeat protein
MKKIFAILSTCLLLASCAEFTELQPKGKNLLSTTEELELLLNYQYWVYGTDMYQMTGDIMYQFSNVPNLLASPTPSRAAIMYKWDESNMAKFAELNTGDYDYPELCGYVGKIANPILSQVDAATGDQAKKDQLKAEAYTLRAYSEYILVNKYAAAYNPSTAANTSGIPYLMEDWDISVPPEQWTVAQVYDQIIADCDAAIALNALPVNAINQERISKACPYAVKAMALMSMQKYAEAEAAAKEVLKINSNIVNLLDAAHTQMIQGYIIGGTYPAVFRPKIATEEDIWMIPDTQFFNAITTECESRFEPGYCTLTRIASDRMMYDYMMGMGTTYIGLDYTFTYDLDSYWNTSGLRTVQQYLILAECEIEKGNFDAAMDYLDAIRVNRVEPEIYAPLKGRVTNKADAILHLKQVSHGENWFGPYNFINRKRWNQLDDYKETFTREIAGITYTLTPESKMWIFPFPMNAMNNNPNLKYNCL